MNIKLVSNWKKFYTFYSIWAKAATAGILIFWNGMPSDLKTSIPQSYMIWLAVGVLALGGIGTIIDQFGVNNGSDIDITKTPVG